MTRTLVIAPEVGDLSPGVLGTPSPPSLCVTLHRPTSGPVPHWEGECERAP